MITFALSLLLAKVCRLHRTEMKIKACGAKGGQPMQADNRTGARGINMVTMDIGDWVCSLYQGKGDS